MTTNVLHVENVTMQCGGVVAVNNLSLDVNEGEIVALESVRTPRKALIRTCEILKEKIGVQYRETPVPTARGSMIVTASSGSTAAPWGWGSHARFPPGSSRKSPAAPPKAPHASRSCAIPHE